MTQSAAHGREYARPPIAWDDRAPDALEVREARLTSDLPNATDPLTGPATATAELLVEETGYEADQYGLAASEETVTVVSHDKSLQASSGTYCILARLPGRDWWIPLWVACEP
ncbi:MAG: hypothetical protein GXP27_14330 [Planctomycetes bacterium]|nr:hypothetical protein [Planctomycetota bacterium]